MRLYRVAVVLVLSLIGSPLASAQTESEISRARAMLYLEKVRHPSLWEKISNEEYRNLPGGLRCSAAFSGFVLTAISSAQNGAQCEWNRTPDSAVFVLAVLDAGSHSLDDMTRMALAASAQLGASHKVLPVEIAYNGCPAVRFNAWDQDVLRGRITLVQKGGHFWMFMATETERDAGDEEAGEADEVYKLAEAYVRPQLSCEALG